VRHRRRIGHVLRIVLARRDERKRAHHHSNERPDDKGPHSSSLNQSREMKKAGHIQARPGRRNRRRRIETVNRISASAVDVTLFPAGIRGVVTGLIFATNASLPPWFAGWKARRTGKSVERVMPAT